MFRIRAVLPAFLTVLLLLFAGWGSTGHKIITKGGTLELPVEMLGFIQRASMMADSASNADIRKGRDPAESPKHFIDIDDYPEFASRSVSHSLDSLILKYGLQRVTANGFLPWAISAAADSLASQMQRGDWNKAWSTAADLGHYVGDAHMPLHCTTNYDGQFTGNRGIHSRYESSMVDKYQQSIVVRAGQVSFVANALDYAFSVIYGSHVYCDSVLQADNNAKQVSGWNGSGQEPASYYTALWARSGGFTNLVMQRAADAFAALVYSAWVRAGKPNIPTISGIAGANEVPVHLPALPTLYTLRQNYPNPFNPSTNVEFRVSSSSAKGGSASGGEFVSLKVFDVLGTEVATLVNEVRPAGTYTVRWNASTRPSGVYFYRLHVGEESRGSPRGFIETKKMILAK